MTVLIYFPLKTDIQSFVGGVLPKKYTLLPEYLLNNCDGKKDLARRFLPEVERG